MRELKFRVWSDFYEKYADFDAELYMEGSVEADFTDGTDIPHHEITDLVVEQYTGLKDKNGEEIYEGDIIRCHGDDRFIAPVIRHDKSGGFCWVSCYKEECFIPESDEVEVIGNIHENPELLRDEQT